MELMDIVNRNPNPAPWAEGEKIPWNEPGFSGRMLREHLTQEHDAASRRFEVVDRQVEWIHTQLLGGRAVKVLDLGCGPGLYASRLAKRGCSCTGIDFSPASIAYAKETALQQELDCQFIEGDVRSTDFGSGYELAMLIYGELNTFRRQEASHILAKAYAALEPDGLLVLEPHPFETVKQIGLEGRGWYSTTSGLFSAAPHLYLEEKQWDEASATVTIRYYIIDARDGSVTPYAASMQAYTNDQYRELLEKAGFKKVEFLPSLEGIDMPETRHLMCIVAHK
jgi:ubiquinone/menaquinone biosynthesis C-methylase UbiE